MNSQGTAEYLSSIDTRSLVDKVEMNLIDFFIKKEFKPGDTIPKEVELATAMGVSRTVIRESLTRLKTLGIIESIKHKGTIIKSPDLSALLGRSMIPNILDNTALRDIFELRLILEVGMADSIINNITEADINELTRIVETEPEESETVLFNIDHEVLFHGKLYEITQNKTLQNFQKILLPVFKYAYDSKLIERPVSKKKYISHKGLVELLKTGSAKQFRNGMRKHLENHFSRLTK
jgi:GntR family transcriptional regulator, transcriptional repressor for pyruvate dehydrogenase complex